MAPSRSRSVLMAATLMISGLMTGASGAFDIERDDPVEGETWVYDLKGARTPEGHQVLGTFRSTSLQGTTRQRDFRIAMRGTPGREDRVVTIYRRDPACDALARLAGMDHESFCDQITWRHEGDTIRLAFRSLDANRGFHFVLAPNPRQPGSFLSVRSDNIVAPALSLDVSMDAAAVRHTWTLEGHAQSGYGQISTFDRRTLDELALTPEEASLVGLAETLNDFNRFEFADEDLGRAHPNFKASPYSAFGEKGLDGGCILLVCFGDLGGSTGGGGGSAPDDPCDPNGNNFTPQQCPWDLTYATWPASQRVKIWKPTNHENKRFGFSMFTRNDGPGDFRYGSFFINNPNGDAAPMVFVTLKRLGEPQPILTFDEGMAADVGDDPTTYNNCYRLKQYGTLFGPIAAQDWPYGTEAMPMGGIARFMEPIVICRESANRPKGRYRLHVSIDPAIVYDEPTKRANNTGSSGVADWIRFR